MLDLTGLTTEARNPRTMALDKMAPLEIVTAMNREDMLAVEAVRVVLPKVATAISWATEALERDGRIIYLGAGTSGRLGALDAAECPPTFGVSERIVAAVMAGGRDVFTRALEGAEDREDLAEQDLSELEIGQPDVVIGLAASGRTPYVLGGLRFARAQGCKTVAIACNRDSPIGDAADLAIEPVCGPEVLTGSTRLKAGTAQKLILNMISTGAMVGFGKVFQNLMVDVKASNDKLCARALGIVGAACGCGPDEASAALDRAGGEVKVAIVSVLLDCSPDSARERLARASGHVRAAIGQQGR